jgi:hypothetical protein
VPGAGAQKKNAAGQRKLASGRKLAYLRLHRAGARRGDAML